MRTFALISLVCCLVVFGGCLTTVLAQTPAPAGAGLTVAPTPPTSAGPTVAKNPWKTVFAGALNSGVVLFIVWLVNLGVPKIREAVPVLLPLLATVTGPLVMWGQVALSDYLGTPVDLSPMVGLFSGASAVMLNQLKRQTTG